MIDARRLLLLAEVDRCGSIAGAAAYLSYTPSAVSQQISRLEREIGQPVLERHPRRTVLTEVGRLLVAHAARVRIELEAASAELVDLERLRSGSVSIGAFPSATSLLLPPIVRLFSCKHPSIGLTVRSAQSMDLVNQLVHGEIEVAILSDYEWRRIPTTNFNTVVLARDPMKVLVPNDHKLANCGPIALEVLRKERWIVRADHPTTEGLLHSCRAAGFEPSISFETGERLDLQAMVAMGLGIAAAPILSLGEVLPEIAVIDILDPFPERRIFLAHLRRKRLSNPAVLISKVIRSGALSWAKRTDCEGLGARDVTHEVVAV
jgi:molybdate transport repressor ModE-like protein